MKLIQQLRTKYNGWLESAIRLTMLTAVTFTVTACYGTPPEGYYNDPDWQKEQDTLVHNMERLGKRVVTQQHTQSQPAKQQAEETTNGAANNNEIVADEEVR